MNNTDTLTQPRDSKIQLKLKEQPKDSKLHIKLKGVKSKDEISNLKTRQQVGMSITEVKELIKEEVSKYKGTTIIINNGIIGNIGALTFKNTNAI